MSHAEHKIFPGLTLHRHNDKTLDLSRNVRLAGLSSGAKLELVLSSRSPSVVSVALQLPEPDSQGFRRLTNKFPSNTTIWMLLRSFESGENGLKRNFTGRGVPVPNEEGSGVGRLFFESPVLQIMGRELSSFTDLQRTLAQIGFNSGSALIRMTFRRTETPLEDAMQEIEQYFNEVDGKSTANVHGGTASRLESIPWSSEPAKAPTIADQSPVPMPASSEPSHPQQSQLSPSEQLPSNEALALSVVTSSNKSHRPLTIFSPSTSNTPKAAQQTFHEKDYEPTIDHAKLHQSRLAATAINKRLPSDAEIAAQAELQAQKNAKVKEIEIKIRFPDQMQAVSKFSSTDTANTLYDFVKHLMIGENEPFTLRFSAATGPKIIPSGSQGDVKLVTGLGMVGRVLVNVVWEEGASLEARAAPVLKEQYREKAREIEVQQVEETVAEEKEQPVSTGTGRETKERKGGLPKWFKQIGKK